MQNGRLLAFRVDRKGIDNRYPLSEFVQGILAVYSPLTPPALLR